jgi:hypothetical protein
MHLLHMLFWLLVAHCFADYAGQGDFLANAKNRNTAVGKQFWVWGLPSHALIHAGFVTAITGSYMLGLIEFLAHGVIDSLKCDNKISYHQDQFLHVMCKVIYVASIAIWPDHYTSFLPLPS